MEISGGNIVLRLDATEEDQDILVDLPFAVANFINDSPSWTTLDIRLIKFVDDIHNDPDPEILLESDSVGLEHVTLQQLEDRILDVNIDMGSEMFEEVMPFEDDEEYPEESEEEGQGMNPREIPGSIKQILRLRHAR